MAPGKFLAGLEAVGVHLALQLLGSGEFRLGPDPADEGNVDLFIDRRKFTPGIEAWLGNRVTVRPQDELGDHLRSQKGKRIQIDPATASSWLFDQLKAGGATIVRAADPVLLPKACKNATELQGTRRAHERDGAALSRFLAFMAKEGPKGQIDEIEACRVLEDFRAETGVLRDLSFGSISGAGPSVPLGTCWPGAT